MGAELQIIYNNITLSAFAHTQKQVKKAATHTHR